MTGLWRRRPAAGVRPGVERLFPELADPFFAAERLRPDPVSVLDPSFSVVVVLAGDGGLETAAGHREPLTRGRTVVVPHSAGECRVTGQVDAIRCLPGGGLS